jgi:hypothetical protein
LIHVLDGARRRESGSLKNSTEFYE